jgi:hypothetical protein
MPPNLAATGKVTLPLQTTTLPLQARTLPLAANRYVSYIHRGIFFNGILNPIVSRDNDGHSCG